MGLEDFEVIQSLGKGAFAHVDKVRTPASKRAKQTSINMPQHRGQALIQTRSLSPHTQYIYKTGQTQGRWQNLCP